MGTIKFEKTTALITAVSDLKDSNGDPIVVSDFSVTVDNKVDIRLILVGEKQ